MLKLTTIILLICSLSAGCRPARDTQTATAPPAVATPTPDAGPGVDIGLPSSPDSLTLQLFQQGRGVVPLDQKFRNGDGARLRLTAAEDGYFYVLVKESEGTCALLLPHPKAKAGSNRARRHQQITLPDPGWFRFRNQSGTETLYVVFARKDERPLARLFQPHATPAAEVAWLEGKLNGADGAALDANTLVRVVRLAHQ